MTITLQDRCESYLRDAAVPAVLGLAQEWVRRELAEWQLDPMVEGVVGLVLIGTRHDGRPGQAIIIIYPPTEQQPGGDFEVNEQVLADYERRK